MAVPNTIASDFYHAQKVEQSCWEAGDQFPLPTWSAGPWLDALARRWTRWIEHWQPWAVEWWQQRGYLVAFTKPRSMEFFVVDASAVLRPGEDINELTHRG